MTPKQYVIAAMESFKGDDLERAERAFGGYTQEEMQQQHGESGKTRQQILDAYRMDRARWVGAMAWLKEC